jgi:hypothetical protein
MTCMETKTFLGLSIMTVCYVVLMIHFTFVVAKTDCAITNTLMSKSHEVELTIKLSALSFSTVAIFNQAGTQENAIRAA